MEWQQLEYFQIVAQTEHFTRAAEVLSISQPTLSRSIAKLEEELGVPLFERLGRRVVLNHYGKLFYERTARILQEMSEAKQEITDLINPEHGTISFAFLKSLGASSVPKLVSLFLQQYPYVHFNLFQNATNAMLDQVESGEIDFCLSSMTETRKGVEWMNLWSEEIFACVPIHHPLAYRHSVSIRELAEEKFITLKQGYSIRTIFDQLFEQAGIKPNITFEGDEVVTVIGFITANLGIALLPKIKGVDMNNIKCLSISEPLVTRSIGIAWSKERYLSPVARRFREFLMDYYKERG
jgi:DNA-binding transcriptional LysR family regulator